MAAPSQTPEHSGERTLRSGTSVRNPRRRPRDSNADSVRSAPRRKRSKIDEGTFVPPRMAEEEEAVVSAPATGRRGRPRKERGASAAKVVVEEREEDKENFGVRESLEVDGHMDGEAEVGGRGMDSGMNGMPAEVMPTQSMVVRGGRKGTVKRPLRGDVATVLTQNVRYAVKLLPSTPRELKRDGLEYRGCLGAGHHALAVTRERAYIWDYTSHAPVNNARVFDMPFPVRRGEPLLFGALVAHGGSSEMGLVLVHASTGKIVFYDSIERAASLGLFQERNTGVEGSIPGLFSGETVSDLIPANHAGFVLTLTSGRIVQLLLRDAQGKARIFAQFLRATEPGSGGLFGSIKGFLGTGGWKKDVAAVHTRPLGTRGQMQVLSLTERAELQVWDLDWSGQCQFKSTIDFREIIAQQTRDNESPEMQGLAEDLMMLDFAIVDKGGNNSMELATLGTELPVELLVLFKHGSDDRCSYMLAELKIAGEQVSRGRVLEIVGYRRPAAVGKKPKLLLPKPQHTALIAFEDALVVTSIGEQEGDSPDAQLRSSYTVRLTFEDSVFLSRNNAVLSASEEDGRGSSASSIVFVQGAGLVRLTTVDPEQAPQMSRIPIKSKIEQAVFYGAMQDDKVINFGEQGDDVEEIAVEVETAALNISDEILRSTSEFIATDPTSMDAHLAHKAEALSALASHVKQKYPVLGKAAMWRLLWDAERVAAAQQLWTLFNAHVTAVSSEKRVATVLDEVCGTLQEQDSRPGDPVQNFFVHHLNELDKIFTVTKAFLNLMDTNEQSSEMTLRLLAEANDIWIKGLEAVYHFREQNATRYGILPEYVGGGVLSDASEYAELSEFWTSTKSMLKSADEMCKVSRQLANDEFERNAGDPAKEALVEPLTQGVCIQNPALVQILCNIYQERIHWQGSRPDRKDRDKAAELREHYDDVREAEFRALASVAQTEAGLQLAEKYRDMHTLTMLVVGEMQFCMENLANATGAEREAIVAQTNELTARIGNYFERFGHDWANAYFDEGFAGSNAGMMLRDAQVHWQDALSRYLRADDSRARICWIDDVTSKRDYQDAARCLLKSGREQEGKLWNKKVELSMAKLTLLATREGQKKGGNEEEFKKLMPEADLAVVGIQERLYQNIRPEVLHCIDRQAELEVAIQKYVIKNQDLHALRGLLESCLAKILDHDVLEPADLIDVLTLIDSTDSSEGLDDDVALNGNEFYLALQVLNAVAPEMKQDHFETTLQLLWKRCYVYDSEVWNRINVGDGKRQASDTIEILRRTAPWRTLEFAADDGFFEAPDGAVRFLAPSECLGAGCRAEDLSWRWQDPELMHPILADNRTHDEQVQDLIASQRLDGWIERCVEGVKAEALERAEDRAATLLNEREFEASYAEGGEGANGVVKVGQFFQDVDGEEGAEEDGSVDANGVEESAEFDYHGEDGMEEVGGSGVEEEGDGDVEMS